MNVIPAIDLMEGKCVRLYKGDFSQSTEYSDQPVDVAIRFSELDVTNLHIVDLDGARTGSQRNTACIRDICRIGQLDVQLGGGIRETKTLQHWFDAGVSRCVIGSLAVTDPALVISWLDEFGVDRLVLALDVNVRGELPLLATHGWTATSETTLWDALDHFSAAGLAHVLCTDISRDGAMSGPNITLYEAVMSRYPHLKLQASGGIRNAADLQELAKAGIPAAISGRALLDGMISSAEVAAFRQNA